jgi:hypothetical protein
MDEIGEWIYYIIMAVVVTTSLLRGLNKKKGQQQTQIPAPESSWEDYPEVPVSRKKNKKSRSTVSGYVENKPYAQTKKHDSPTEFAFSSEEENTLINELNLTDVNAFRNAIIYTEILNRKY